jgi:acetoin utilization deacetylase AcuC-like enzyme
MPSDLDVALPNDITDEEYNAELRDCLRLIELKFGGGGNCGGDGKEEEETQGSLSPSDMHTGGSSSNSSSSHGNSTAPTGTGTDTSKLGTLGASGFDLVFFQAGVDALAEDRLGNLSLTHEGLRERNRIVFEFCRRHSLPVVVCMGGGYSRPIGASVRAHCDVFVEASRHQSEQLSLSLGSA